jgi:hypothetical protein
MNRHGTSHASSRVMRFRFASRQALAVSPLSRVLWMALACVTLQARADELAAADAPASHDTTDRWVAADTTHRDAGWRLAIDNDMLMSTANDRDYTGGIAVTFAGPRALAWPLSLDPAVAWLDPLVPGGHAIAAGEAQETVLRSLQFGLMAFTPDNLKDPAPIPNDRPYASLVFVSNSRTYVRHPDAPVYDTSLAVGMLGLDAAELLQRGIHEAVNSPGPAAGWDHQVSDGGEPTLRLTIARQALLAIDRDARRSHADLKWRLEASAGYLTEASVAISGRWGLINTPWWSMSPERADYVLQPAPVIAGAPGGNRNEFYVWAGLKARVRAYNVFLQGQFRDSDVELAQDELEAVIGEAWLGVTWQFSRHYWLSQVVRYQTREIERGPGSRDLLWAGLIVTHDL